MTRFPATRCEGNDNVLCLQFQRIVFEVSTCCVCGFNVLCWGFQRVVSGVSTRCG